MLKVVRSPAKVCWHIVLVHNGLMIETAPTKKLAEDKAAGMEKLLKGWKL